MNWNPPMEDNSERLIDESDATEVMIERLEARIGQLETQLRYRELELAEANLTIQVMKHGAASVETLVRVLEADPVIQHVLDQYGRYPEDAEDVASAEGF